MPDIWTKHPEIVRALLQEGGVHLRRCPAPRVLRDRDPAWTCIIDGKTLRGDLYIHHVEALTQAPGQAGPWATPPGGGWELPAIALLGAVVVAQGFYLIRLKIKQGGAKRSTT